MKAEDLVANLDPAQVFQYLKIVRALPSSENQLKKVLQDPQVQDFFSNSAVHKILGNCDEKIYLFDKGFALNLINSEKCNDWLCSYIILNLDEFNDPRLSQKLFKELAPHRPFDGEVSALWFAIILLGSHLPRFTNINHLLFKKETKADNNSENVKKAGMDKGYYFFFCEIVNGVPGARAYIGIREDEYSDKWNTTHLEILTSFSQTTVGIILAVSCYEASYCACEKKCYCLDEFNRSMSSAEFVSALIELSRHYLKAVKNNDMILVGQMADTTDDNYYNYLEDLFVQIGESQRELHDAVSRRKDSLRRRPRGDIGTSTKELITAQWLPKALWNKTSAEILAALPQLSSGQTGDDHGKDCKKIDKAIRELGLTRMTAPKS